MEYTYKYPRPAVTADCVVITKEAEPKVLLIQRGCCLFSVVQIHIRVAGLFPAGS